MNEFAGAPARSFERMTAEERLEKLSREAAVVIELRRGTASRASSDELLHASEDSPPPADGTRTESPSNRDSSL